MAVRDDFAPGEVLAAADLNDTFASKVGNSIVDAKGDLIAATAADTLARLAVGANGAVLTADSSASTGLRWSAGQKILQIVRATDGTDRSTTSTSFVDASISVTITPQKSDSAILLIWAALVVPGGSDQFVILRITDNSNNAISGAQANGVGTLTGGVSNFVVTSIAYATPATTSSVTYKGRYRVTAGSGEIRNATTTGQLYAIEVSA